ncbi:hypothetical protein RDV89_15510 [Nocardioides zeae]|uniref:Uncharacterized protein n=1 Tax=Nocardioides imazamoxiresistens TaxID=3231893 RepID=A0ABU3PZ10_9ACTN|nr:hypothetical protein [Nocardioides zeae]MDT9594491.1 hypothetical protein [Nocardioides zeae]
MTTDREGEAVATTGTTSAVAASGTPGATRVPPMVSLALRAASAQMVVMAVATVATYLLQDALRDAWLFDRAVATNQSVDAVRESPMQAPGFFPVALTLFVTYVLLALVLVAMVRVGARWALYSLTALVVMSAVLQLVLGTTAGAPVVIMLLAAASVALHGLTVLLLWHPANARFFRNAHNGHWARVVDADER